MAYEITEDHIIQRSMVDSFMLSLSIGVISIMMNLFILIYLENTFKISIGESIAFVSILISVIVSLISLFRYYVLKFLITKIDNKKIYSYFSRLQSKCFIRIFLLIILLGINTYLKPFGTDFNLLISSLISFLLIYFLIFMYSISDVGLRMIEFQFYRSYNDDAFRQQHWLNKIAENIENSFYELGINLPKEKITYEINRKKLQNNDVNLDNIEKWFHSNKKDYSLYILLKDIFPDIELEPIETLPWYEQLRKIPIEHLRILIVFITAIMLLIINPELPSILLRILENV